MKKKKLIIFIVIIVVIVISISTLFITLNITKDKKQRNVSTKDALVFDVEKNEWFTPTKNEELDEELSILSIYYNNDNEKKYFTTNETNILINNYYCISEDCEIVNNASKNGFFIIEDNGYNYVYDSVNNKAIKTIKDSDILESNFNTYLIANTDTKAYGVLYLDTNEKGNFYSFDDNKIYAIKKLDGMDYIDDYADFELLGKGLFSFTADDDIDYLYDYKGNLIKKDIDLYISLYYDDKIYFEKIELGDKKNIYNEKFEKVFSLNSSYNVPHMGKDNKIALANDDNNKVYIYNDEGKLINTLDYNYVVEVDNNYIFVLNDKKELLVIDYDNNIKVNYGKFNLDSNDLSYDVCKNYVFDSFLNEKREKIIGVCNHYFNTVTEKEYKQ